MINDLFYTSFIVTINLVKYWYGMGITIIFNFAIELELPKTVENKQSRSLIDCEDVSHGF